MKRLKTLETSKKILGGSWAVFIAILVCCIVFKARGDDISDLVTLALGSFAEVTAAHGFYYWKAKNENRAKGTAKLIRDLAQEYGIEAAARFAEIIYKD